MKGQLYFGAGVEAPSNISHSRKQTNTSSPLESLSQREREVLQHVVEGKTSADIADILFLSPKSVETYRSRLMLKLKVNNIPSLVKFALLHGITSPDNK
jgi:DNA-binding CsgD family transcriptional regulator